MSRLRTALLAALLAVGLALTGCVSVPTQGRVERVEGQQQTCQNCVNVEVAPPAAGDDPRQVVEGFLRANANYQPGYAVARQFLTAAAAQKWSPEDGVAIYRGTPSATGDRVALSARLVGSLGRDRAYTVQDRDITVEFGLVRENGEWRIGTPPAGLMVAEYFFAQFYSSYDLYFVGSGGVLVPDPIYLPTLRNPANVASALVKALLNGPSRWLAPAVSTAIPPGTTLSVDSVTVADGIASVPLSDAVLALPDTQRSLLAAQVVYTLKQALAVRGVLITVNQQGFRVPEGDPATSVVNVNAVSADHDPVTPAAGDQLYVVRDGAVQLVDAASTELRRLPGDLGSGRVAVDSVAVSVTDTDLAAVVADGTRLLRTTTAGAATRVQTVIAGVTGLLRPQFTRFGELWVVSGAAGAQTLWSVSPDGHRQQVSAPALKGRDVVAFKVSPDGSRVAFLTRTARGDQLAVARVNRADRVSVDGWRGLDTTQSATPQLTQLRDVGWLDATTLLVLGAATAKDALGPFSVSEDASTILNEGEAIEWDPVGVTVLLRTQSAVVLSRTGQTWRDQGSTWQPLVDHVSAVAYPG